jgi:hypothetical protein
MKWLFVFLIVALTCSHFAFAQDVRRCVKADGSVVFTDRACSEQEQEKLQPEPAITPNSANNTGTRSYISLPPSCNRSPDDLLYGIRSAINMSDVNQLAKQYHWPGVSDAQAEQLMNRLELLVKNPLIDIQLLYPVEAEKEQALIDPDQDSETFLDETGEPGTTQQTTRAQAYALRVVQYLSNTNNQTQSTTFRLQRHFDCWWIRY